MFENIKIVQLPHNHYVRLVVKTDKLGIKCSY